MEVPYFSAKSLSGESVEGFYYSVPNSSSCPIGSVPDLSRKHFLITVQATDWGLPYNVTSTQVDPDSLKIIKNMEIQR